jgi:hypothetical protein
MTHLIDRARKYADPANEDDKRFAVDVDGVAGHLSHRERNDIVAGNTRRYLPHDTARAKLAEMLNALESQINGMSEAERVPFVLREVGYTDNGPRRLEQHGKHSFSNKMMNLFEAISYADKDVGSTYYAAILLNPTLKT